MGYPQDWHKLDEPDITRLVKDCQAVFARSVKHADEDGFGERLRQAFKDAGNSEIARQLGAEPSTITNYMKGRIPPPKTLVTISNLTNCSIDWLITGEGEAGRDPYPFLDNNQRAVVQGLASRAGVEFENVLSELVIEAMARRASDLMALYPNLRGHQFEQLRLLLELVEREEVAEDGPSVSRIPKSDKGR